MTLPVPALDRGVIEIAGEPVEYRSLTRDEVITLSDFGADTSGAEAYCISASTGVTLVEAIEWRKKVNAKTAAVLLDAIAVISGLSAGKDEAGN